MPLSIEAQEKEHHGCVSGNEAINDGSAKRGVFSTEHGSEEARQPHCPVGACSKIIGARLEIAERDFPMNIASILTIREGQRAAKVAGKVLHVDHAGAWLPVLGISHAGVCVLVSTPLGAIIVRPGIGKAFNIL